MYSINRSSRLLVLAGAIWLAACSSEGNKAPADSAAASTAVAAPQSAASADTTKGGMAGMAGMQGGQMGGAMSMSADSMRAHLRMMEGMDAGQMTPMLATHRQMVANMLARANDDMRKMNMPPDTKWTALTDSIRQDLTRFPELNAAEAHALMPKHGERVMRLMEMHRAMMGNMKM